MKSTRKVFTKLFTYLCMASLLLLGSCDAKSSQVLMAGTKKADNAYLSYKVNSEYAMTYSERISRNSAVQVELHYPFGSVRGSGTYFKYKGHHMVITAAHLFAFGPGEVLKSEAMIITPGEKVIGTLAYVDHITDIAIFKVPTLDSRKAAKFKRTPSYEIGSEVVYSGFPGANNLLTIPGVISGEGYGTDIAMHSFAWGGSSGSGVFDDQGRYVGVLVSIMVGRGFNGPQLVGTVVYIAPANLIDTVYLRQNLDKLGRTKNGRF